MTLEPERDADFRRFVEAHWLALVRSAYLILGDHGAAQDLVQQTLVTVHRHWDRRVSEGAPMAYARRVMVNRALSHTRRQRVSESLFGALGRDEDAHEDAPAADALAVPADRGDKDGAAEDPDLVVRALGDLPPRTRTVVVLRYFDDLTEAATAEVLGMSVGSVQSHTSRGLHRLHAFLTASQTQGTFS